MVGKLHKLSSKWKFELDCYGILDNFKNQEIVLEELLKGLISKELISEEMDGTLRITKKGIEYVSKNKLVSESPYPRRLENLRSCYPQAYKPWTTEEEKQLTELFDESKSVGEISKLIGRQSGGIRSRLRKIGLIKD